MQPRIRLANQKHGFILFRSMQSCNLLITVLLNTSIHSNLVVLMQNYYELLVLTESSLHLFGSSIGPILSFVTIAIKTILLLKASGKIISKEGSAS